MTDFEMLFAWTKQKKEGREKDRVPKKRENITWAVKNFQIMARISEWTTSTLGEEYPIYSK